MLLINVIFFFVIQVFCGEMPVIIRPGFFYQGKVNFNEKDNGRRLYLDGGALKYSNKRDREDMSAKTSSLKGMTLYLIGKDFCNKKDTDLPPYQYPLTNEKGDKSGNLEYILMDFDRRWNGTSLDLISSYNILTFEKNNVSYKVPVLYYAPRNNSRSNSSKHSCSVLTSILKSSFDNLIGLYFSNRNLFNERYRFYASLNPMSYQQHAFYRETTEGDFDGRTFLLNLLSYLNNLNNVQQADKDALRNYFDNEKEKSIFEGLKEDSSSGLYRKLFSERCYSILNEISIFLNDKKLEHCVTTEEKINLLMNLKKYLIFDFNFEKTTPTGGIVSKLVVPLRTKQVTNDGSVLKDGENLIRMKNDGSIKRGYINCSDLVFKNNEGTELKIEFEDFKVYKNSNYNHVFVTIPTDILLKNGVHSVSIKKFGIKDYDISDDLK